MREFLYDFVRGIIKLVLVYSVVISFCIFGIFVLIQVFVINQDTPVSYTFAAFGLFALLSNICFSYYKTFETKDEKLDLRNNGEKYLFSALGFIIAGLMDYMYRYMTITYPRTDLIIHSLEAMKWIEAAFLFASFIFASEATHSLLNFLFDRVFADMDKKYRK